MKNHQYRCNICHNAIASNVYGDIDGVGVVASGPPGAEYRTLVIAASPRDGNVHFCNFCLEGLRGLVASDNVAAAPRYKATQSSIPS